MQQSGIPVYLMVFAVSATVHFLDWVGVLLAGTEKRQLPLSALCRHFSSSSHI